MALSLQNYKQGGSSKQEDLLNRLLESNYAPKPKASFFERLLAVPSALGSIPDALYQSKFKNKNAVSAYLGNLGQGLKTTFLGEKDETPLYGTSDYLKKSGMIQGNDMFSKGLRGTLGFIGDVALDPTTYLSFGTAGLGKKLASETVEGFGTKLAQNGLENLGKDTASKLTQTLSKKGFKGGVELLTKQGYEDAALVLGKLGKDIATPTTMKFLGKDLITGGKGVQAAEALVNPLGTTLGLGKKGFQKLAPEAYETVAKGLDSVFKPGNYYNRLGYGNAFEQVKDFSRGMKSEERRLINDLMPVTKQIQEQAPELQAQFGDVVEGFAQKNIPTNVIDNVRGVTGNWTKKLTDRGLLSNPNDFVPDLAETATQAVKQKSEFYFPRDVLGFKPDYIQEKFGSQAANILGDKRVVNDIAKDGFIKTNTLNDVLKKQPDFASTNGLRDPVKYLLGSEKERTFDTMSKGLDAGVVYNQNAAETFLKGALKTNRAVRAYDFATKLPEITDDVGNKLFYTAKEFGKKMGEIPVGYKKFNIQDVGEFVAPQDAYKMIKNYGDNLITDEGLKNVLQGYDKMMQFWKSSVTGKGLGFVGYNVRNAIGDFTNMLLDGFKNPANIKTGFQVLNFEKTVQQEGLEAATKKYGSDIAKYYDEALNKGILTSMGQIGEEVGSSKSGLELAQKAGLATQAKGVLGKADDIWTKITSLGGLAPKREEAFRVAHFVDTFQRTNSWDEAGKAVRRSLFDYSELSPVEKNVFKRIIPFYSFASKNLQFHLNNYVKSPGKYTTMQHLLDNVRDNVGADMSEEDWAALPEWMKGGVSLALGKKGNKASVLTGFGLPTEAVDDILGGDKGLGVGTIQALLRSTALPVKVPLELATGQNFFSGKQILDETYGGRYASMPDPVKKLLGYRTQTLKKKDGSTYEKQTVDPIAAYIMANLPLLSPASTMYKRVSEVPDNPANLVNIFSGGRIYTRDIDQERESRQREAMQRLQQMLARKGMGGSYESFNIPQENRAELERLLGAR